MDRYKNKDGDPFVKKIYNYPSELRIEKSSEDYSINSVYDVIDSYERDHKYDSSYD